MDGETYTHFTYWGLTLSFVLSATWLVAMHLDKATWTGRAPPETLPRWEGMVMLGLAVPVLGVLFAVAVLITAMPILDVDIIVAQGGDTSLAVVNVANIVIHYVPPVVIVVVIHMRWAVFCDHLWWVTEGVPGGHVFSCLLVGTTMVAPLGVACLYTSTIDFNEAYGVNVRPMYVYHVGLFTCTVFCLLMWPAFVQAMHSVSNAKQHATSNSPLVLAPYVVTILALFFYRCMTNTFSMHHFTYWGLSISCVFALAWLTSNVIDTQLPSITDASPLVARGFEGAVLVFGAVPTLGILVCVATLISAVPMLDIGIVEAQAEGHPLGVVNAVNLAMHYVPPALLVFVLHERWVVFAAHLKFTLTGLLPDQLPPFNAVVFGMDAEADADSDVEHYRRNQPISATNPLIVTIYVVCTAIVCPLCVAGMYTSTFDFNVAYGVKIAPISIHAVGIATCFIFATLVARVCTVAIVHTHKYTPPTVATT